MVGGRLWRAPRKVCRRGGHNKAGVVIVDGDAMPVTALSPGQGHSRRDDRLVPPCSPGPHPLDHLTLNFAQHSRPFRLANQALDVLIGYPPLEARPQPQEPQDELRGDTEEPNAEERAQALGR